MNPHGRNWAPTPLHGVSPLAILAVVTAVFACSIYANLQLLVRNPAHHRFFPPFEAYHNGNMNAHLGAEYFNIAEAMAAGRGFSNPFAVQTGPTAWMPPVLPTILTAFLWLCGGSRTAVMGIVVFLQGFVLIATGLLTLALTRDDRRTLQAVVAAVFVVCLLGEFRLCFQVTHDGWLVLLIMDALLVGLCCFRPLACWESAACWGMFGGLCALINPIVALTWGLFTLVLAWRRRAWRLCGTALLAALLTLTPWTIRNYMVFGRFIPVKSNLVYELYQSQCVQPDGLIQRTTFATHPYAKGGRDRQEYAALGEMAFLDRKKEILEVRQKQFDRLHYESLGSIPGRDTLVHAL